MLVRVLGPVSVIDDAGEEVSLSPQLRRLLGLLVVADGAAVGADRLAEYASDGRGEGSTIRTAVSRLRKVLGDRLEAADGGYRLVLADGESDAASFEAAVAVESMSSGERIDVLAEALALWSGDALGDLADEEWATGFVTRLRSARTTATEDLGAALLGVGRARDAIEILESHVLAHPFRERPVGSLMRALAAEGRTAEGLRVFERFRLGLRDELGLDPSPDLRAIESELLNTDEPQRSDGEDPEAAPGLPTGTVTFLFTDIEGSTERWANDEVGMAAELAAHDEVLRSAVEASGGIVFKHTGDGMCAVFSSATDAVAAGVAAQDSLGLPVRMGVHTGEAELREGDYFGPTLNRVARIMDAGHGGQLLMSNAAAALVSDVDAVDLGEHRLKGLAAPERIHQVGRVEHPPLRVASAVRGNLPSELSSFIGRGDDLASLTQQLVDHRLVTLIGVGGTGKTRLAIEAARALAPMFPGGCWLAQLALVSVDEAVPYSVLSGLDIPAPASGDPVDHLVRQLRHERLLLIVDNCEHVLGAAADVIDRVVTGCPNVTIIATSREPLMVNGEQLVPVASLEDADAVKLFGDRATAEAPGCLDDDDQRAAAARICERLDRLPLAIELAASRVRTFTPVELHDMLDQRFRVLVGGRRSRMERHQTMRGTLDWSYDLCSPIEQRVFDRLAVCPGWFDTAMASTVGAGGVDDELDVVDAVAALVDRSLLRRGSGVDGTTRFGMLETMRAYGRDHLVSAGELDAIREVHAQHVLDAVRAVIDDEFGPDEEAHARREIERLVDVVAASGWLAESGRWWDAIDMVAASYQGAERETFEMVGRIRQIAATSGAPPDDIEILRLTDPAAMMDTPEDELNETLWQYLRSGERRGTRFAVGVPRPRSQAEVLEMLSLVENRPGEPVGVYVNRAFFAVREVIFAGYELPAESFERLESTILELDSRTLRRQVEEVRGQLARSQERWSEAAVHFAAALPADDSVLRLGWHRLIAYWNTLDSRAIAGDAPPLSDLRAAWEIYDRYGVDVLRDRGCMSTAAVLATSGHRGLAERFVRYIIDHAPAGYWDHLFGPQVEQLGLGLEQVESLGEPESLDALLAELRLLD